MGWHLNGVSAYEVSQCRWDKQLCAGYFAYHSLYIIALGGILLLLCTCWNVLAYCKELNTWTKFWWWNTGTKWPTAVKDVFEKAYGKCTTSDYCFQRLPEWTKENKTEILAVDSVGTIYRWKFDSSNPTAHAVWLAFHDHQETPANKVQY